MTAGDIVMLLVSVSAGVALIAGGVMPCGADATGRWPAWLG